jgi:N-acetylglucosaminyl-diphospho-decaprenol L-rhamnosyltransferase
MSADKLQIDPTPDGGQLEPSARAVDVVIVSADMGEMTVGCVQSLRAGAGELNVIVVDNAFDAPGEQRALLEQLATVVCLPRRTGFAAANNRGMAVGSAPFVLLLNSDILAVAGSVEGLLDALLADPLAVTAGGRLVDPETLQTQEGYRPRPFPTLANFIVVMLGVEELWPGNPITRRYHGSSVHDEGVQVIAAQPAAAALMVRREALSAIGGLDERFWFWFEDSDLLLRLGRRGRILYVPGAVFRHLGGGSFARWSKAEHIRSIYHGILHYGDAHFPRPERAALGVVALLVSLPRIILFSRSRPREAAAWRAVAAGGAGLIRGRPVGTIAPGP